MGASESTAKSNGATEEEEERQQRPSGASIAAGVAVAGVAAWGISRMLSDNQQKEEERQQRPSGASIAAGVAAAGVSAWGISRMLSDNQQKEDAMNFRAEPSYSNSSNNSTRLEGMPSGRRGFKMNTDGACHPNQGSAGGYMGDGSVMRGPSGYGGILLDDGGKWVRGFRGFIGVTDSLTAEFHGIFEGLQLLDTLGVVDSILESDSQPAVDWIIEDRSYRDGRSEVIDEDCWEMIKECKRLKKKNRITVGFCSRKDNKCADKLASMAIDKREPYVEIMYPPDEIKDMIV